MKTAAVNIVDTKVLMSDVQGGPKNVQTCFVRISSNF